MTHEISFTPSRRAIDWADRTLESREIDVHPMTWEAAKEIKRLADTPSESVSPFDRDYQQCSGCRRLTHRLEKIDKALDEAGAPVNGDWDGLTVALSQVGRIKRLTDTRSAGVSIIDLSLYVNAANISAADVPHVVVEKLQGAINAKGTREINQCDGCRRGLPTRRSERGGLMHDGDDGMPVMMCEADKYTRSASEGRTDLDRAMELYPDRIEHHEARAAEKREGKKRP